MTALHSYPNMHISQSNTLHSNQLTNNSHVKILVLCYPLYFFFGCFGVFLCLKCTELLSYFCNNICRIPKETNNIIRSDHILENSIDYAIEGDREGEDEDECEYEGDDEDEDESEYEPPEHLQREVINTIAYIRKNTISDTKINKLSPKESIEINTDDDNDDLPSYSEVYRQN